MSVRRVEVGVPAHVAQLQKELNELKNATAAPLAADSVATQGAAAAQGTLSFDDLSGVEKSAASLGVHPDAWRPIGFVNNAHYKSLLANNQLDGDLARRIEAFGNVAKTSGV